jgi:aminopeptidase YwaD
VAAVATDYERQVLESMKTFGLPTQTNRATQAKGDGTPVFRRRAQPRGPLTVFGYDYFEVHAKSADVPLPRMLSFQGEWGAGEEYAYEALNFADGRRSARQITNELSAEYGPIPVELVTEYLQALKRIGVVD